MKNTNEVKPTLENPSDNMKPSKELFEFAKQKAQLLTPNKVIRLKGGEYKKSYYLFNICGAIYIGSYSNEKLVKFFKNKPEYDYTNNHTKEIDATMQLLMRK
tara:strand:- start:329 stop:634 length:306 start_codon:yes stop_codon:yes gene_type:complete